MHQIHTHPNSHTQWYVLTSNASFLCCLFIGIHLPTGQCVWRTNNKTCFKAYTLQSVRVLSLFYFWFHVSPNQHLVTEVIAFYHYLICATVSIIPAMKWAALIFFSLLVSFTFTSTQCRMSCWKRVCLFAIKWGNSVHWFCTHNLYGMRLIFLCAREWAASVCEAFSHSSLQKSHV